MALVSGRHSRSRTLDPPHRFHHPRLPNKSLQAIVFFQLNFFLFFLFFYEKDHTEFANKQNSKRNVKKKSGNSNYPPTKQNKTKPKSGFSFLQDCLLKASGDPTGVWQAQGAG